VAEQGAGNGAFCEDLSESIEKYGEKGDKEENGFEETGHVVEKGVCRVGEPENPVEMDEGDDGYKCRRDEAVV